MNSFDDICRELSADLAAAVEAQTQRTLRPRTATKKPRGIEETKRRIKAAFEKAEAGWPNNASPAEGRGTHRSASASDPCACATPTSSHPRRNAGSQSGRECQQ